MEGPQIGAVCLSAADDDLGNRSSSRSFVVGATSKEHRVIRNGTDDDRHVHVRMMPAVRGVGW